MNDAGGDIIKIGLLDIGGGLRSIYASGVYGRLFGEGYPIWMPASAYRREAQPYLRCRYPNTQCGIDETVISKRTVRFRTNFCVLPCKLNGCLQGEKPRVRSFALYIRFYIGVLKNKLD